MNVQVNVINQRLKIATNLKTLVSGSQEFIKFEFCLGEDWDGLVTFAQFRQGDKAYNKYLDEENCVHLPPETKPGICMMMLYGVKETVIATTNYVELTIDENMLLGNAESVEITEPLYNQLVEKVHRAALPYIGENGNWYYDNEDTGISALGRVQEAQDDAIAAIEQACQDRVDEIDGAISNANTVTDNAQKAEDARVEAENARVSAENTRKSQEAARQQAEASRAAAETERSNAEDERIQNEQARQNAEAVRDNAEAERIAAETQRKKNETERQTAEANRATAEDARADAESTREQNEDERKTAEAGREDAEAARVAAENIRKQNETARQEAEALRDSAETTRKSQDTARQNAEAERDSAENERIAAENARITNENARQSAEANRSVAETERSAAEEIRKQNELEREAAEDEREQAEIERANEHDTLIDEGNQMIEKIRNMSAGVSPTVDVTNIDGGHRVTITDVDGAETFDVMNGKDGVIGGDGDPGVGVESVEQTTTSTEDSGTNVVTVTLTDGTTSTFTVKNGSKGNDGAPNEIDTTLSISGAAADAAVTGSKFSDLTNSVNGKVTKGSVTLSATDDGAGTVTLTVLSNS